MEGIRTEQLHREVTLPTLSSGQLTTPDGNVHDVTFPTDLSLPLEGEAVFPEGGEGFLPLTGRAVEELTYLPALAKEIQSLSEAVTSLPPTSSPASPPPSMEKGRETPPPTLTPPSSGERDLRPVSSFPLRNNIVSPHLSVPTPRGMPLEGGGREGRSHVEVPMGRPLSFPTEKPLVEPSVYREREKEPRERGQGGRGGGQQGDQGDEEDPSKQRGKQRGTRRIEKASKHASVPAHAPRGYRATTRSGGNRGSSSSTTCGGIENIFIRFMALMARILGQAEAEAHDLYIRIKERTDTIDFLTTAVSKINAEKGAIDWTKDAEMQELIEKLRNLGVEIPAGKYKWTEEEKRLLKENIQMKKEGMEKISQLERTDMQRYLQEASQCHQARSNILKLLKEVMDTITHNIRP